MSDTATITIAEKEYIVSPLRCKHLKEITKLLADSSKRVTTNTYADIDRWMPFMLDSLRFKNPDIDENILGEMTLQEFQDGWGEIVRISGIKVVNKGGEAQSVPSPAKESTTKEEKVTPITTVN